MIAVFHCPFGITGESALEALLDAGVPASYLRKEFRRRAPDKGIKKFVLTAAGGLGLARVSGKEAFDSLLYVALVGLALRYFRVEKCFVRRIAIGKKGNPSLLKLLRGFVLERIPVNRELVSPSGAAVLAAFCEKEDAIPTMKLESVGEAANELRISIGEAVAPYRRERVLLLETNLDDMSPQGFELLYERLFEAGALDVWVETLLMKKMRPAFKLSVLLSHRNREKVSEVIFKETPSLGVRFLELDRFSLPRKMRRVKTRWGSVRVKQAFLDSRFSKVLPEYEDLKRIAERRRVGFPRVLAEVRKEVTKLLG